MAPRRLLPLLVLLACLGALAAALIAQYVFGLLPCVLCLYQRVPFAVAAVLAAVALFPALPARLPAALIGLAAVAFAVNVGIAAFHVGVEQHWWPGLAACTGGSGAAQTVEDLKALLAHAVPPPACDNIPWALFGVSMAGYNVLWSLALAGFAGRAAGRLWRDQP